MKNILRQILIKSLGGYIQRRNLKIPTYDGGNQAVHPDIVFFPARWHHYHYWMVFTPFPYGNERYENPSIVVSEDGLKWMVPSGATNPLIPAPTRGFYSDPDMIYHPHSDSLFLYYRHSVENQEIVKLIRSSDGLHWSRPKEILSGPLHSLISPSILYIEDKFYLWSVRNRNGCTDTSSEVEFRESADGTRWTKPAREEIEIPGYVVWHLDVICVKNKFVMLIAAYPVNRQCDLHASIFLATRKGNKLWDLRPKPLLKPNIMYKTLYRATGVITDHRVNIWYSQKDILNRWSIAYQSLFLNV